MTTCVPGAFTGQLRYTFLNPGGEHLSSGDIPLPRLYFVISGLWFILNVLWCWNWIKNRSVISLLFNFFIYFPGKHDSIGGHFFIIKCEIIDFAHGMSGVKA